MSEQFVSALRGTGRLAIVAAAMALPAAGQATDYNEGTVTTGTYTIAGGTGNGKPTDGTCTNATTNGVTTATCTSYAEPNDLAPGATHYTSSYSNAGSPVAINPLTTGDNMLTGATYPYGPVANSMTGELYNQDSDYFSFTVPVGTVLSKLLLVAPSAAVPDGTTILPNDRFFIGIASGTSVTVNLPSSAGLLGYTLASASDIGSNILPALGTSAPAGFAGPPFSGATTFSGPLGAGTYTLWLLDGDGDVNYKFDLQVSATPEPATWGMMILGFGLVGWVMRRRRGAMRTAAFA